MDDVAQLTHELTSGMAAPEWHAVGDDTDFGAGRAHAVDVAGERLVLFRDGQGELYAMTARCPHMGADLDGAAIDGDEIVCPIHFWRWDSSGRCTLASHPPRAARRLVAATWPVRVDAGTVYVGITPAGQDGAQ